MTTERDADDEDSPANWQDAPTNNTPRLYGSNDCRLNIDGNRLTCKVSTASLTFVYWFWPIFVAGWFTTLWFFAPADSGRTILLILTPAIGIAIFMLLVGLFSHHVKRGDYIRIDRSTKVIELPRHDATFALDDAMRLQQVQTSDAEYACREDLYLVVGNNSDATRYHLFSTPQADDTRAIAEFLRVRVETWSESMVSNT